eukprot:CAMPEP_0185557478 /NCGR_PEP_ID=MMETSP1381-20130426/49899_1 /TAXON_ID=298111 /ORGANISM="Pavlova sp., Strain CCMP459" /LENGTH=110 /DNA_ID=CAMNT_0028170939 /DNA_START=20 /DNA_END=349 /DNA_ORIENTATION=+
MPRKTRAYALPDTTFPSLTTTHVASSGLGQPFSLACTDAGAQRCPELASLLPAVAREARGKRAPPARTHRECMTATMPSATRLTFPGLTPAMLIRPSPVMYTWCFSRSAA